MKEAERYLARALEEARLGFGEKDAHVASACNNLVRAVPPGANAPVASLAPCFFTLGTKDHHFQALLSHTHVSAE